MNVRVTQFHRAAVGGAFSFERLYEDINAALPGWVEVRRVVGSSRTDFLSRFADILRAPFMQSDVAHVTGQDHYLTLLLRRRRTILTVHDLIGLHKYRGPKAWLFRLLWYRLPISRAETVVAISDHTRSELVAEIGCDPGRVKVIHNCVSDEFRPWPKAFPARPTILQVGTRPHKNLGRVAEALSGIPCELLIVGGVDTAQRSDLDRYRISWRSLEDLSFAEMVDAYRTCDLLVFASTYEGFGLPIIEAQAIGRPVVTSDCASMPEVAGGAACIVNPLDVASIRSGIQKVIEDAAYRERLVGSGLLNVERFRASAVADRYADLYRRVADGS